MKKALLIISSSFSLLLLFHSLLLAQSTAQISGTVKDESGAVLPGVEVNATQTETGVVRSTVSNETGSYVLPNLAPGPYKLEAALPGFRTFVQTGIVLQVGTSPVINPTLQVGQVTEQVEVQANAAQIETRSAGVGQVIENQRILELPLNGRQVTDLITLGGAALQTGTSPGYGMRTGVRISVAGGEDFGVQYNLDGAPHIHTFDGTSLPLPFPDALQEFKFSTSTQDASQGGRSGANVSGVIKSGTNTFHGDLFEFVRNSKFNARDFFATRNDGLKRNQFGGTIGGPISKDRVFFFAGYQGTTVRQDPATSIVFVPTPQMVAGDFTAIASPACNSGRQLTLRAPFVNGGSSSNGTIYTLPASSMSPAALKIASLLPHALDACGTYRSGNNTHENNLQIPVRVDYQVNTTQSIFGRYMLTRIETQIPKPNIILGATTGVDDTAQGVVFGHTYIISPTVVNAFRVSANRIGSAKPQQALYSPAELGINIHSYLRKTAQIAVSGAFNVGCGQVCASTGSYLRTTEGAINDDITWVKGAHQFAFGGYVMRSLTDGGAYAFSQGALLITNQFTGSPFGDFFTGQASTFRQANPQAYVIYQDFFGTYAQDTWKITPRLTANLGVRWEPFFPMQFKYGNVYNFSLTRFYAGQRSTVIPSAPPGFTYPGDPGFGGKAGEHTHWNNIDPRIAFAWDPTGTGKTAIRIGGGIAHNFLPSQLHVNTISTPPFALTVNLQTISLDNPWATYPGGNPFPYNFNPKTPAYPPYASYEPVPSDFQTTTQYSWNLGIQQQVNPDLFVSATYLGTQMIHIWDALELNPALNLGFGPCTLNSATGPVSYPVCTNSSNVNQRRILNLANPSANLGYLTQYDFAGTQRYNGLLTDMRWRRGQNLNFNVNYTWSHCIGMQNPTTLLLNLGDNYIHQPYQNTGPQDRHLDYGDCNADRRHIFNFSAVARTPQFANSALRVIASGWSFSPIVSIRSGAPLTVVTGTDVALNGFIGNTSSQRPNQILGSPYGDRSALVGYLNVNAFALPASGTFGNLGRNNILGPGYWDWSQAVSRQFRIGEEQTLEVRAEAFNVTNSLRPGNPAVSLASPGTLGRITSSVNGPRIMQLALKYTF